MAETEAELALAALVEQRSALRVPISPGLAAATEAVAGARIDDPRVPHDDVLRLLDSSDAPVSATADATARVLGSLLVHPPAPMGELVRVATSVFDGRHDQEAVPVGARFDLHPRRRPAVFAPAPLPVARSWSVDTSLARAVAAVVDPGSGPHAPSGAVQRCLLSTWPARSGRLDGVPLVLSPSLGMSDAGNSSEELGLPELMVAVVHSVRDAARRMARAERGLDVARARLRRDLRWIGVGGTTGAMVADLLARHPVQSTRGLAAATSPLLAATVVERLRGNGRIVRLGGPSDPVPPGADDTRWYVAGVIAAVTAPFDRVPPGPAPEVIDLSGPRQRSLAGRS